MSYNYLFKLIVIGEPAVGKTALVKRLVGSGYLDVYEPTIGVDFLSKVIRLANGVIIKSHIWDTAGQECFGPIIKSYYKGTAGAVLVFDVGKKRSFEKLDYWLKQLDENKDHANTIPIVLVGNKVEAEGRAVSREDAQKYATGKGIMYVEASAKKGINIDKFFRTLIINIYNNMDVRGGIGIKKNSYPESFEEPERSCATAGSISACCNIT